MKKWSIRLAWSVALVFATLVVGGALDARWRLSDLKPWHHAAPGAEFRAGDLDDAFTLSTYLQREDEVFRQVEDEVEASLALEDQTPVNRYFPGSRSHYSRVGRDWNRSFELQPSEVRGGALLVHGLTDSPYSVRAVAEVLRDRGYYALAIRMPGHGTVPAGLVEATWEDWLAAVRLGARHVRERIGADRPLVLVGYSNGGALVVKYALDVLDGSGDPAPERLILLSPMIGVSPAARMARVISLLGPIPFFEKAKWLDVLPEYNPFKYNSFPANAAFQTFELCRALQAQIARADTEQRIGRLAPILAFQSLVDATVSTHAVVRALFDHLADGPSELVLFDINRLSGLEPFIRPADAALRSALFDPSAHRYHRTLVTNAASDTLDVSANSVAAGATTITEEPLGLAWPREVFSLTHIALPFPTDDPLYGTNAPPDAGIIALGRASPRGERAVLTVPVDTLMRLSSNPFFPYLAERVRAWVDATRPLSKRIDQEIDLPR